MIRETAPWQQKMTQAMLSGDVEWFRAEMSKHNLPMSSPQVPEVTMHKCRVDWAHCPPHLALESRLWLRARNFYEGIGVK